MFYFVNFEFFSLIFKILKVFEVQIINYFKRYYYLKF